MNIQIEINTDNSAFENNEHEEVKRAINDAIDYCSLDVGEIMPLRDINGNTVGKLEVTQ